jgi:hypothetical protein
MIIRKRPAWVWISVIIAVIFGIMTIKSGGSVLFFDGEARQAAGNYVDFVLWFNFLAGFFYIATGMGLWLEKAWAPAAAITIAALTLLVFAAFGLHILNGGEYEQRTVIAMSIRTLLWVTIALTCWRQLLRRTV